MQGAALLPLRAETCTSIYPQLPSNSQGSFPKPAGTKSLPSPNGFLPLTSVLRSRNFKGEKTSPALATEGKTENTENFYFSWDLQHEQPG